MKTTHTRLILILLVVFASVWTASSALAEACPTAPRPRLSAGIEAVVAEGVGPLNVRRLPAVSTGIADQLYGGNRVTVISGPSCNGGFNWWRVETGADVRGWVAEGTWERYWLIPARDLVTGHTPTPLEYSCPSVRPVECYVID